MPNTTSLSLNDGVAAKTYNKTIAVGDTVTFVDSSADTTTGQPALSVSFSPSSARRATTKVNVRLNLPYEQTIDGEIVVKHVAIFSGTFTIPGAVPATERSRMWNLVKNFVADSSFEDVISSPEAYF